MARRIKGDLQVTNDAQIDNNLSLPAQTGSRALELDGSGNVTSSAVTSTELGRLSGVTSDIQTQLNAKQDISEKGAANGYASLDGSGKIPAAQLPSSVMEFKGAWDANTNSPTLTDGTGDAGDVYRASVAGTQDLGSGSQTWAVGDLVIYNGSIWEKSPASDAVQSVFGRTGVVVAAASDYDADQIDYNNATSGLTATNVQAAIDEVEGRVDGLEVVTTQGDLVVGDVSGDPSRLGIGANGQVLTSNGTTAAWQALPAGSDENVKVSANDTTAGYLEDKIVAANGVNATNPLEASTLNDGANEDLQIQFDESKVVHDNLSGFVANEHVDHSSVTITAGDGLSGGGDITASRTIDVDITNATDKAAPVAADEVLLADSAAAGAIKKADVGSLSASIDHDATSNFVANEHIDHSTVDIGTAADSGLTGGGDITTSRSLSVDIAGTTVETSVAGDDEILIYDTSAGALRSMSRDNFVGTPGASAGDISETSFSGANNQAAAANVTGLAFANGTVRSFKVHGSIVVDATADLYEEFELHGIQKGASWEMSDLRTGDDSLVDFTITAAGQVQYTSASYAGFVSLTMKFRAITTSV